MKSLSICILTAALSVSLHATTVFYNTTGAFTGGTATATTDSITFTDGSGDIATLTYTFDLSDSVTSNSTLSNANFGVFSLTVNNPGVVINIPSTAFTLTIDQTTPGNNTSPLVLTGTLSAGPVSQTSSAVNVSFSPNSGVVTDTTVPGTATYAMNTTPITPESTGVSTLTGTIDYVASQTSNTPEPETMAMMGGGLLGLALIARRKRA